MIFGIVFIDNDKAVNQCYIICCNAESALVSLLLLWRIGKLTVASVWLIVV